MDSNKAWEIVKDFPQTENVPEDDLILYEEALNYILTEALELCELSDCDLWRSDVEAGAFNLAFYYEKIGKFDLALKYYKISEEYGCDFASEKIDLLEEFFG